MSSRHDGFLRLANCKLQVVILAKQPNNIYLSFFAMKYLMLKYCCTFLPR